MIAVGAALAFVVAAATLTGFALSPGRRPPGPLNAVRFGGIPIVGALFAGGTNRPHYCTAGVVSSPGHDLIVTAAHCAFGSGKGLVFVPGYRAGQAPYGVWNVVAAYAASGWLAHQDPTQDVAFLIVADHRVANRMVGVQDLTGAAQLGTTPALGRRVTVVAYPMGHNDLPIRCRSRVYLDDGYPAFDCGGYVDGTSGAPWLTTGASGATNVVAVTGGRNQGGCEAGTSYAAPLSTVVTRLYQQAISGSSPSVLPTPGPSGC